MKADFPARNARKPNSGKIAAFPLIPPAGGESRRRAGSENQVEDADDDEQADQEDDSDDPAQDAQHDFPPGDADPRG